jgi:predicted AAA+ superfamily ATPase
MSDALDRIADALDRLSPAPLSAPDFDACDAYLWQTNPQALIPVPNVSRIDIDLLLGVDHPRDV